MIKSGSIIRYKKISRLVLIISLLVSQVLTSLPSVLNINSVLAVDTPEADMGKIVFCSTRDGNQEIYIMNGDGSGETRLTNISAADSNPKLSADGRKIVFDSDRDGNEEIYLMDVDGSNQKRLTNNTFSDIQPTWSPDGTKIAFSSTSSGTPQIWVMNADGSDPDQLTFATSQYMVCYAPDWSYDGTRITFARYMNNNLDNIYVMNADGSDLVDIASGGMVPNYSEPSWSPDNTYIAVSLFLNSQSNITVIDSYGDSSSNWSNGVTLSSGYYDYAPSYSPDGDYVAFYSNRDGNNEIYNMNADGGGVTRLTNNSADDSSPSWGPTAGNGTSDTIAIFPDANLEATIKEVLGKSQGDISQTELEGLTKLNASGSDIADLAGIEYCSHLTSLELYGNDISDISPLSALTSLTSLELYGNEISDISPLSALTGLTSLGLGSNQISDISSLSVLTGLTWLDLSDNQLSDIEPLVNNSRLGQGDKVYLEGNSLSTTSLTEYIPELEGRGVDVNYESNTCYLTVTVSGNGTTSPSSGLHKYNEGAVVDIKAVPDSGWQFDSWTGDVSDPDSDSTTVTVDGDKTVTVSFIETSANMDGKTGGISEEDKGSSLWIWLVAIFGGLAIVLVTGSIIITQKRGMSRILKRYAPK